MTLVLLDTNAYLRLAKRIKPLLGVAFGQKNYMLTILKDVETEVQRSPRLKELFPWFEDAGIATERNAKTMRLSKQEKEDLDITVSVLQGIVEQNISIFTRSGRSTPSPVDCRVLAFGQIRPAIVATDDLGMHELANLVDIKIWHGYELLHKMLSAKIIHRILVQDIYAALDANNDLPASWVAAKHTIFEKIFGKAT